MTPSKADEHVHVLIVGAGVAGTLVAAQLAGHGCKVLMLEAGYGGQETWQGHLEAVDRYRSTVAKVPNSALPTNHTAQSPNVLDLGTLDKLDRYFLQEGPFEYASDYLRAVGGSGMHWLGLCPRMHPEDFATKTNFGYGRDWPIAYEELEPYYAQAEREMGVAGDAAEQSAMGLPFEPEYVYPMHAIPPSYIDNVCRKLDGTVVTDPVAGMDFTLAVFGTPQARNSTPNPAYTLADGKPYRPIGAVDMPNYGERCVGNASCVPYCPVQARWTPLRTQSRLHEQYRGSDAFELRPRCVVTRVVPGDGGRIAGVEYLHYNDAGGAAGAVQRRVDADVVVIAAHAIESARLLLASDLGNRSDQLGRNLMDHPTMLTWALADHQVGPYRGPGSTSGWEAFRFGEARATRAPFRIEIANWGWGWSQFSPNSDVALALGLDRDGLEQCPERRSSLFGERLRRTLGDQIGRQLQLQFAMEQAADPENRVTISRKHHDALGQQAPVLSYRLNGHLKAGMVAARRVGSLIFREMGATEKTAYRSDSIGYFTHDGVALDFKGAGHAAGTHIMGNDPNNSVVDSYQRCWDHANLYAIGCGSMPSVGTSNPTLTMAAMALRSAEEIRRDLTARHVDTP